MTTTSLLQSTAPTLAAALPELLRLAAAWTEAQAEGVGLVARRDPGSGQLLDAWPCELVPMGRVEYSVPADVRRLAWLTGDIAFTAEGVRLL